MWAWLAAAAGQGCACCGCSLRVLVAFVWGYRPKSVRTITAHGSMSCAHAWSMQQRICWVHHTFYPTVRSLAFYHLQGLRGCGCGHRRRDPAVRHQRTRSSHSCRFTIRSAGALTACSPHASSWRFPLGACPCWPCFGGSTPYHLGMLHATLQRCLPAAPLASACSLAQACGLQLLCHTIALPLAPPLPAEVLLARDASCVRYGPDGRPAKRAKPKRGSGGAGVKAGAVTLAWSAPPAALGSSGPYVLGLTEQRAEARLLEPLTFTGRPAWRALTLALCKRTACTTMASLFCCGCTVHYDNLSPPPHLLVPPLFASSSPVCLTATLAAPAAELWQQVPLGLPGGGSGGDSSSGSAAACLVASSTAEDGSLFVAGREGGAVKQVGWQAGSQGQVYLCSRLLVGSSACRGCAPTTNRANRPHLHLLPSPSPLQLRPVPFTQQAQQALELGEHEEALALAALVPSEKVRRRLRAIGGGAALP